MRIRRTLAAAALAAAALCVALPLAASAQAQYGPHTHFVYGVSSHYVYGPHTQAQYGLHGQVPPSNTPTLSAGHDVSTAVLDGLLVAAAVAGTGAALRRRARTTA